MTKYIIKDETIRNIANKIKSIKNTGEPIRLSNMGEEIRNLSLKPIEDFMITSVAAGTSNASSVYRCFKEIPWMTCFDNFTENAVGRFQGFTNLTSFPSINIQTSSTDHMFYGCSNLANIGTITLNNVPTLTYMFYGCPLLEEINFNNNTDKGNVSYMFYNCYGLKKINGLENLKITNGQNACTHCSALIEIPFKDFSQMTTGAYMFSNCTNITHLDTTDFPSMTSASYMFENCSNIDNLTDISYPVLSEGSYMFKGCTQLTEMMPMPASLKIINGMYSGCVNITHVSDFDKSNITQVYNLFSGCTGLTEVGEMIFPNATYGGYIFSGCTNLTKIGGLELGGAMSNSQTRYFGNTKLEEIGYLRVPNMTSIYSDNNYDSIFYGATKTLKKVGDVNLSSLVNGRYIFEDCSVLEEVGDIDLSSATSAEYLFTGCKNLKKIGNITFTQVQNCHQMFNNCNSLVNFPSFDMSTATNIQNMFYNCGMEYVPESFNASSVTNAQYAFQSCKNLKEADISLPKATNIQQIFGYCSSLTKVRIRDVENISYWNYAFRDCSVLTEITLQGRPMKGIVTTNMFEGVSKNGVLYYDGRYDYSAIIAVLPSTWTAVSTYTPTECVELHITADNVKAKQTQTTIHWTAITNGIEGETGERMEGIEVTGTAMSEPFEQNTSYDEVAIREISFTYMGVTATTTIEQSVWVDQEYIVNLNNEWQLSSTILNPATSLYDGVYESFSNRGKDNTGASMFITIDGYTNFKFYIRSNAESSYDYVMVGQLDKDITYTTSYSDTTLIKAHTRASQNAGTEISNYKLVEFTNIDECEHTIEIIYRKDGSASSGDDRGFVLIPYDQ